MYFNVRLEDAPNARQCVLVLMGATPEGQKELIAVLDGYRENEQSWWMTNPATGQAHIFLVSYPN